MSDTIPLSEVPEDIGRNDPCPCGSGRKYKKCCQRAHRLQKEAQKRSRSIEDLVDSGMNAWGITKLLRQMNDNKMYALFYDLAHPEGPFRERYDSKAAFLKAADQGEAHVPGAPEYDLRRIRLDEGLDYLLLTRGLDDPRSETYDYQVVTLRRNDVDAAGEPREAEHPGLRVWDVELHQRAKADVDDGDLTLGDLGYSWGQHRE